MGFIRDAVGRITIESRREGFIIHPGYGYDESGNELSDKVVIDGVEVERAAFCEGWRSRPHPEFLDDDLDDLIGALTAYRESLR